MLDSSGPHLEPSSYSQPLHSSSNPPPGDPAPEGGGSGVAGLGHWLLKQNSQGERSLLYKTEGAVDKEFVFTKMLMKDTFFSVEIYKSGNEQIVVKRMRGAATQTFSPKRFFNNLIYNDPVSSFQREKEIVAKIQKSSSGTALLGIERFAPLALPAGQGNVTLLDSHGYSRLVDELAYLNEREMTELLVELAEGIKDLHESNYAHNSLQLEELLVGHDGKDWRVCLSQLHSVIDGDSSSRHSFDLAVQNDHAQLKKIALVLTQKLSDKNPLKQSWHDWSTSPPSTEEHEQLMELITTTQEQLDRNKTVKEKRLEKLSAKIAKLDVETDYVMLREDARKKQTKENSAAILNKQPKETSKFIYYSQIKGLNVESADYINNVDPSAIERKKEKVKEKIEKTIGEINGSKKELLAQHLTRQKNEEIPSSGFSRRQLETTSSQFLHYYNPQHGLFVELPDTAFATGGSALISLAYHVDQDQLVIMKKAGIASFSFQPEQLEGEKTASQLNSPNVLVPYHTDISSINALSDGHPIEIGYGIILLPILESDLSAFISQMREKEPSQVIHTQLTAAVGMARGIAHYHAHHLLHLDISSGNILLASGADEESQPLKPSQVKIFDHDTLCDCEEFVKKQPAEEVKQKIKDKVLSVQATPLFLAPEYQFRSHPEQAQKFENAINAYVDSDYEQMATNKKIAKEDLMITRALIPLLQKRDVYACSVVLVQLFTRCSPLEIDSHLPTEEQLKAGNWTLFPPEFIKQLTLEQQDALNTVDHAILQSLSEEPSARPSMEELSSSLDWALSLYEAGPIETKKLV